MKNLLILTAALESGAGVALLIAPILVVHLLLGADIPDAAIPLSRVAGAALLALGVACWLARGEVESRAARGLIGAMVIYNFGAAAALAAAGIQLRITGIVQWPAVVLHAAMGLWCIALLVGRPGR